MAGKNNKRLIVICLVAVSILVVILAGVLTRACNTNSGDVVENSQTVTTTVIDTETESIYNETERAYSEEESTYYEEDVSWAEHEAQTATEYATDNVTDDWSNVVEDEFDSEEEVTRGDVMQPQESGIQSESDSTVANETEAVQEETVTQYDGIVLPDDIF